MARPNILMIMADQLAPQWTGAYGHPRIRTPHMDRLASEGVTFDSAYCNSPICAASRASMCTGKYVDRIGAFDNGADFLASTPTFMHHLRRADYEVLLSGKMHFLGPDQLHGFERRLTPEIYPSSFVWTPDWTRGAYANHGTSVDQLKTAGICDWSMQLRYDEEVAFRATEALRELAGRQKQGRPFFLCASFTHPHDPFVITKQWWDLYADAEIDLPAAPAQPMETMHPFNQWMQVHHMVDVSPPTEQQIRAARHAYWGMVSYFDSQIGQLVDELERLKLSENTIVIVTSDHGEMLGEHGMWFKRTFFEHSTRVPLIVRNPHHASGGRRISQTVSLLDLYPTFLDLCEVPDRDRVAELVDGHSLAPSFRGESLAAPNHALCEYYSEGSLQPLRTVVRDRLKYVYVHEQPPLLFDLMSDPHEQTNRIDDPAYASRLAELRGIVHNNWNPDETHRRILASQRDRRWINEAMAHGRRESWDVQPHFDARQQYVRP
jgi:choline-sulfatase